MTYTRVRLSGLVTYRRIVAAQHALAVKPDFDPALPLLIDLSAASELRLTAGEIQSLATKSPVAVGTPRAILVSGDLTVFGTARLLEIVCAEETGVDVVRVCRTLAEASEWLGVSLTSHE